MSSISSSEDDLDSSLNSFEQPSDSDASEFDSSDSFDDSDVDQALRVGVGAGVKSYKRKRRGSGGKKSKKLASRASRMSPEIAAMMGQANNAYINQDYPEAIRILEEVVRKAPGLSDPFHTLGLIWEELGEIQKAVHFYLLSAQITATDVEQWRRLVEVTLQSDMLDEALYALRRCLKSLKYSNRLPLEDVLELDQLDLIKTLLWTGAHIQLRRKEDESALLYLSEMWRLSPLDIALVTQLAQQLHRSGRLDAACNVLEKSLLAQAENGNGDMSLDMVNMLCEVYLEVDAPNKVVELLRGSIMKQMRRSGTVVVAETDDTLSNDTTCFSALPLDLQSRWIQAHLSIAAAIGMKNANVAAAVAISFSKHYLLKSEIATNSLTQHENNNDTTNNNLLDNAANHHQTNNIDSIPNFANVYMRPLNPNAAIDPEDERAMLHATLAAAHALRVAVHSWTSEDSMDLMLLCGSLAAKNYKILPVELPSMGARLVDEAFQVLQMVISPIEMRNQMIASEKDDKDSENPQESSNLRTKKKKVIFTPNHEFQERIHLHLSAIEALAVPSFLGGNIPKAIQVLYRVLPADPSSITSYLEGFPQRLRLRLAEACTLCGLHVLADEVLLALSLHSNVAHIQLLDRSAIPGSNTFATSSSSQRADSIVGVLKREVELTAILTLSAQLVNEVAKENVHPSNIWIKRDEYRRLCSRKLSNLVEDALPTFHQNLAHSSSEKDNFHLENEAKLLAKVRALGGSVLRAPLKVNDGIIVWPHAYWSGCDKNSTTPQAETAGDSANSQSVSSLNNDLFLPCASLENLMQFDLNDFKHKKSQPSINDQTSKDDQTTHSHNDNASSEVASIILPELRALKPRLMEFAVRFCSLLYSFLLDKNLGPDHDEGRELRPSSGSDSDQTDTDENDDEDTDSEEGVRSKAKDSKKNQRKLIVNNPGNISTKNISAKDKKLSQNQRKHVLSRRKRNFLRNVAVTVENMLGVAISHGSNARSSRRKGLHQILGAQGAISLLSRSCFLIACVDMPFGCVEILSLFWERSCRWRERVRKDQNSATVMARRDMGDDPVSYLISIMAAETASVPSIRLNARRSIGQKNLLSNESRARHAQTVSRLIFQASNSRSSSVALDADLQRMALRSFIVRQLAASSSEWPWPLLASHFCSATQRISAAAVELVHCLRLSAGDPVVNVSLGAAYTAGWSSTALHDPAYAGVLALGVFQDHLKRRIDLAKRMPLGFLSSLLVAEAHYNLGRCSQALAFWASAEKEYLCVLEILENTPFECKRGEISIKVAYESCAFEMIAMTKFNLSMLNLRSSDASNISSATALNVNTASSGLAHSANQRDQARYWMRNAIVWE